MIRTPNSIISLLRFMFILCSLVFETELSHSQIKTVIFNGSIWDSELGLYPAKSAIVVEKRFIVEVNSEESIRKKCVNANCRFLDARGGFIMPGFHDSHAHMIPGGSAKFRIQVVGSNVHNIVNEVKKFSKLNPSNEVLRGRGWYAAGFGEQLPNRHDLDKAESQRPVILVDSDGHQLWVNSKAIEMAGIDKDTPDPEGGKILRDETGHPSGIFIETAGDLITDKLPSVSLEEKILYAQNGQQIGLGAGFTTWQGGPEGLVSLRALKQMEANGNLNMRSFVWGDLDASQPVFDEYLTFQKENSPDSLVQLVAFKGFVDGVISSYTAAMKSPYSDRPETAGEPIYSQEKLNKLVVRANQAGFPVAIHAIGDRGVKMVLDAYENSLHILHHRLRNRIEHIESLDPADARRFGALQVVASMQPAHMLFNSPRSSYYPERLGLTRLAHSFPWNELRNSGALLCFGTDFPVVNWDPIEGIHSAITRTYYDGTPFFPEQKVDGETALRAFTVNSASIIAQGRYLGKIQPGYLADIVTLPSDPRNEMLSTASLNLPTIVMVDGRVILKK